MQIAVEVLVCSYNLNVHRLGNFGNFQGRKQIIALAQVFGLILWRPILFSKIIIWFPGAFWSWDLIQTLWFFILLIDSRSVSFCGGNMRFFPYKILLQMMHPPWVIKHPWNFKMTTIVHKARDQHSLEYLGSTGHMYILAVFMWARSSSPLRHWILSYPCRSYKFTRATKCVLSHSTRTIKLWHINGPPTFICTA